MAFNAFNFGRAAVCSLSAAAFVAFMTPSAGQADTVQNVFVKAVPGAAGFASGAGHALPVQSGTGFKSELHFAAVLAQKAASVKSATGATLAGFYPADLSYYSGSQVKTAQTHAVYINCTSGVGTCWGSPNPDTFLKALFSSTMIHIVDQYVGVTTNGRYTVGTAYNTTVASAPHVFSDATVTQVLTTLLNSNGGLGGTGHIYNIFLPQGTDICSNSVGSCYSPDNTSQWGFCAFHDMQTITTTKYGKVQVLYTIQPYQNVGGCQQSPPSGSKYPNSVLIDSTASTLSHELFETITDPSPGSGWVSASSLSLYGSEIGDLCQTPTGVGMIATLGTSNYLIQAEYSNTYHACVYAP